MSRGVIIGKFLPPHRGHQYLIDFARNYVQELTVQVCSTAADPIPGSMRYEWMREAFGSLDDVEIVHNPDLNPLIPEDDPDHFWDIWKKSILTYMPTPNFVFASEGYGLPLAETLGARYVPVDPARQLVPVSGTAIRRDPLHYWEFILPSAQPWFLKRVAIVGPESSGKSTMAQALALHYHTRYVAEYARAYLDTLGFRLDDDIMQSIARGQRASEQALARQANRVLFSDTEALTTQLWSQILLGGVSDFVRGLVREQRYDLYLVTRATESWTPDAHRFHPEKNRRIEFEQACIANLSALQRNFVCLEGDWQERQARAIAAVDALLNRPTPLASSQVFIEG